MDNDKNLLDGIISDYYNSVEDSFFYRLKNDWKINISFIIFTISILFLVVNILPILPITNENYFLFLFDYIKKNVELPFEEFNFWIKWGLGSIVSLFAFGISFILFKYWDKRDSKMALSYRCMTFCYAFTLRKELKSYLINDNQTHLENILSYFKKIISSIILTPFCLSKSDGSKAVTLNVLRNKLFKEFEWIEFSTDSNNLIDSLSLIDTKIERRLKQKVELDKVIPFIDFLVLYEFSKIKPNELNANGVELKEQRNNYIKEFANQLNRIEKLEEITEETATKRIKVKSIITSITGIFSSSNILAMFFSWLVLLTTVFVFSSVLVINSLKLTIDSTILIGLLTAPFIGAITLVATLYTKNKQ